MGNEQRGGFLVEAGFMTGLMAVAAAAAVPRMLQGSIRANEQLAIETLERVAKAQKQLRTKAAIDCDGDRRGEYGFFGELTGTCVLRTDQAGGVGTAHLQPPVLSPRLGRVMASRVSSDGYVFQIYLPDTSARAVAEATQGGASGSAISAHHAEQYWCCYAWPKTYRNTGKRVFFINHKGQLLAGDNSIMRYGGVNAPAPNAAFDAATSGYLDCATAAGAIGADGQHWTAVR